MHPSTPVPFPLCVSACVCARALFLAVFSCRCFAVGSRDMSTWVFGAKRWENLIYYSLGGHKDAVVGCFFEKNSLDVSGLGRLGCSGVGFCTIVSSNAVILNWWSLGTLNISLSCRCNPYLFCVCVCVHSCTR